MVLMSSPLLALHALSAQCCTTMMVLSTMVAVVILSVCSSSSSTLSSLVLVLYWQHQCQQCQQCETSVLYVMQSSIYVATSSLVLVCLVSHGVYYSSSSSSPLTPSCSSILLQYFLQLQMLVMVCVMDLPLLLSIIYYHTSEPMLLSGVCVTVSSTLHASTQ